MSIKHPIRLIVILMFCITGCSSNEEGEYRHSTLNAENILVRDDLQSYFDSCGVEGSIVIYDIEEQKWIVSDTVGIHLETLPASSFKIINLLIALETKEGAYIFATRLLQDRTFNRADFGSCRKDITKKIFRDLAII